MARIGAGDFGASSVALGTVKSQPLGASVEARLDRLAAIVSGVEDFILRGSLVVIEAPAYSRQAGARHERSGLWWMVARAAKAKGCRVVECSPTARQRYAVGRAGPSVSKADVKAAMSAGFPAVSIANDDEADALVLAALGARLIGFPVDADVSYRVEAAASVRGEL
ncbi:hypothetical protein ACXR2W_00975 [Leucobacter sp. HY1908]